MQNKKERHTGFIENRMFTLVFCGDRHLAVTIAINFVILLFFHILEDRI